MVEVLCNVVAVSEIDLIRNVVDLDLIRGYKEGASLKLAGI